MPRAQYTNAHDNLHLYLINARVPALKTAANAPERSPDDDFLLSPEPDSRRRLKRMLRLMPYASTVAKRWVDSNIPNRRIRMPGAWDDNGDDLTPLLPAHGFPMSFEEPRPTKNIRTLARWVEPPMITAERIVRTAYKEETKGFALKAQTTDLTREDADIYKNYYWKQTESIDENSISQPQCTLILSVIAPWAMNDRDMIDFVKTQKFPSFAIPSDPTKEFAQAPLERKDKIWAKLWDDCSRKRCPFFVLTNYSTWVFGALVSGWTTALISNPIMYTDRDPQVSVLDWLVYWISSAMALPGSWTPNTVIDRHFHHIDISDRHSVSTKILSGHWDEDEDGVHTHEEWLRKYHRHEGAGGSGKLTVVAGAVNTWMTTFDS